ncbi:nitroreductase family deazaflavin-dependent oxidoreductase [Mycobacterium sp. Z3061]|uniref:nitroreductase family deazaflavin-dependent oxidoreductase n=1 Tax=Mycobacterium sp. Z3061 TaxID=3073562 RepID=UPI0028736964|nr:nitroreductase family deazaflavin-dependent oxidoreductase [Mycobacterium sp. Z3061]
MTTQYQQPHRVAQYANTVIRWLAESGVSIAGTQALRVRGRKTGQPRSVVVNVLVADGAEYLVSPRGNTQWARNVRAAGEVETGPRWRRRRATVTEVADDDKPEILRSYLQRWFWQVKDYVGGVTPQSGTEELRAAGTRIPVFALATTD